MHAFIKLVDPIGKQQEWAAPLREGTWELRVTPGWQGSALTVMGTVPRCSNQENRADPMRVIRVSREPRHPQTNLPWPATSEEKAAREASGVRAGPRGSGPGTGAPAWWVR